MAKEPSSLADFLAPITPETFFSDFYSSKPLHIPGSLEKFSLSMSWERLNALLNSLSPWRRDQIQLLIDGQPVAPATYCLTPHGQHGKTDLPLPDPEKVIEILRRGASLLINGVDILEPTIAATLSVLGNNLEAEVRANLCCLWKNHRTIASRFHASDAFVIHLEGESSWHLYQGQWTAPVNHPEFEQLAKNAPEDNGQIIMEVSSRPGDLLYLPRGVCHNMTTGSDGAIYIVFLATAVTGIDYMSDLFGWLLLDEEFRANTPRLEQGGGDKAFADHLRNLARRLADIARSPQVMERFRDIQQPRRFASTAFNLPGDVTMVRYRVARDTFSIKSYGNYWLLAGQDGTVQIALDHHRAVTWAMERDGFTQNEFDAAFPDHGEAERDHILAALETMKVIART